MTKAIEKKAKILVLDIETSYSVVATFGIWNVNIPIDSILDEWYIICAAWKWLDDDEVHTSSILDCPDKSDKVVVQALRDAIVEADIIIGHNSDKFDVKKLNTRIIQHGMEPMPPVTSIDTLKVAKKYFKFTSNKLDYIAQYLGVGSKLSTSKGLWLRVLRGDDDAVQEMLDYNKVDVVITEKVYYKFRPYMAQHPHLNLYTGESTESCPACTSKNLQKRGFAYTGVGRRQRFQCIDCAKWSTGRKSIETTNIR